MSDKFLMNRLANSKNGYQGKYKRVLCVCSAGLLRSPTTAYVLSQEPYNYNTRAAALIPVDSVLLEWADEIVCMEKDQAKKLRDVTTKPVVCINVPDIYPYRDPELVKLIKTNYDSRSEAAPVVDSTESPDEET